MVPLPTPIGADPRSPKVIDFGGESPACPTSVERAVVRFAMVIDVHVHLTLPEWIQDWRKLEDSEPYFALLSGTKHNKFADAEGIVAGMDQSGVDKSIVFGFGFQHMENCRIANDYTIDAVKRYPDRLIGYITVVPGAPDADKEIDRCLAAGLKGIGELFPDGQRWALEELAQTQRFADICLERHLPVIIHANEPVGHDYAGKTRAYPERMAAFADHHPELTTIFAHWGGGLPFYELMPEIRKSLRNCYYDTAATPFLYKPDVYRVARALGILDKLLLGSDYPLLSVKRHVAQMTDAGLTEDEIGAVCGGNALRMLGME